MDDNSRLSLKKRGWTDPQTGEYYPGGNPNEISKANTSSQTGAFSNQTSFPEFSQIPQPVNNQNQQNQSGRYSSPSSVQVERGENLKFCKYCGKLIHMDAVICTNCGRQVETLKSEQNYVNQTTVIQTNIPQTQTVVTVPANVRILNRVVSIILCILFGGLGFHRFYEGKVGTGILWLFTGGMFGIGWLVDIIILASLKNNDYYIDGSGRRIELPK